MTDIGITEQIHDLALEVEALDSVADRVFNADDWCQERDELVSRLEKARDNLSDLLEALR